MVKKILGKKANKTLVDNAVIPCVKGQNPEVPNPGERIIVLGLRIDQSEASVCKR
jgi:hypothetical protein